MKNEPKPKTPKAARPPPAPRRLTFDAATPFRDVQAALARAMQERGGVVCPCCGQQATVYRRHVTLSLVKVFWLLYRFRRTNGTALYAHIPTLFRENKLGVASQGGEWAKGRFWGLVEQEGGTREDGSTRTGFARLTDLGVAFLTGNYRIRRTALIYNNALLAKTGELMTVAEVKKFDYRALFGDETPSDTLRFEDEAPYVNPSFTTLVAGLTKEDP